MVKNGLVSADEDRLYVEFGAGRAGLSSFVAKKLQELGNKGSAFLAVDRDTRRFKLDKEFRGSFLAFREKMDISHFDLARFRLENSVAHLPLVCIAKHLCGGATDLALAPLSQ